MASCGRGYEQDLPLKWVGTYRDANPAALTTVEALVSAATPPADAVASLRSFITEQRWAVPDDDAGAGSNGSRSTHWRT